MEYFGNPRHIAYCIVSMVIVVILVIPPTLFLLAYPALPRLQSIMAESKNKTLQRLSHLKIWIVFSKPSVQQFVDLFQSSYKDQFRYFVGLGLLLQILMVILWNTLESREDAFMALAILSTIMLVVHSASYPRINPWINKLDSVIYGNLIVVAILGSNIYHKSNYPLLSQGKSTLFVVLIFLPSVYLALYIWWKGFIRIKNICKQWGINNRISAADNEKSALVPSPYPQRHNTVQKHEFDGSGRKYNDRYLEFLSSSETN